MKFKDIVRQDNTRELNSIDIKALNNEILSLESNIQLSITALGEISEAKDVGMLNLESFSGKNIPHDRFPNAILKLEKSDTATINKHTLYNKTKMMKVKSMLNGIVDLGEKEISIESFSKDPIREYKSSVEGIGDFFGKIKDAIVKFFKAIGEKLKKMWNWITGNSKDDEKAQQQLDQLANNNDQAVSATTAESILKDMGASTDGKQIEEQQGDLRNKFVATLNDIKSKIIDQNGAQNGTQLNQNLYMTAAQNAGITDQSINSAFFATLSSSLGAFPTPNTIDLIVSRLINGQQKNDKGGIVKWLIETGKDLGQKCKKKFTGNDPAAEQAQQAEQERQQSVASGANVSGIKTRDQFIAELKDLMTPGSYITSFEAPFSQSYKDIVLVGDMGNVLMEVLNIAKEYNNSVKQAFDKAKGMADSHEQSRVEQRNQNKENEKAHNAAEEERKNQFIKEGGKEADFKANEFKGQKVEGKKTFNLEVAFNPDERLKNLTSRLYNNPFNTAVKGLQSKGVTLNQGKIDLSKAAFISFGGSGNSLTCINVESEFNSGTMKTEDVGFTVADSNVESRINQLLNTNIGTLQKALIDYKNTINNNKKQVDDANKAITELNDIIDNSTKIIEDYSNSSKGKSQVNGQQVKDIFTKLKNFTMFSSKLGTDILRRNNIITTTSCGLGAYLASLIAAAYSATTNESQAIISDIKAACTENKIVPNNIRPQPAQQQQPQQGQQQ